MPGHSRFGGHINEERYAAVFDTRLATGRTLRWGLEEFTHSGDLKNPFASCCLHDVPGQACNACSSGCPRNGVPGTSVWGLEEFTHGGDWKNSPTAGIGRIHPLPAAEQDVPGQACNACSFGCSRNGVPGHPYVDWKNSPTAGIGRIPPPPAALDVPGQARNACSPGCSRSGVPVTLMWGLEEFTHILYPTRLPALSSPCANCRAQLWATATV